MSDTAIVYYRFNLSGDSTRMVHLDTHSPILASIATLRAHNRQVKVYVLSPHLEQWGDFPSLLDFHVVCQPNQMPVQFAEGIPLQHQLCSRIFDLWHFGQMIPERYVIYSDADIFWLKDPMPDYPITGFQGDTRGAGYFRFDTCSLESELFVNLWRSLILGGIASAEIQVKQRISGYHSHVFQDETSYCYLIRNGLTKGWSELTRQEHYFPDRLTDPIDPAAKCLHSHSGLFFSDRLRVVRRVREFSDAIKRVLPAKQSHLLLGGVEPDLDFTELGRLAD